MKDTLEIKKINSYKDFVDLVKIKPNPHISSILSLSRKGIGINLKNIDFSFVLNPVIQDLKKTLITEEIIELLRQFAFKEPEKRKFSFITFINCSFDSSYKLFGEQRVNLIFSSCQFQKLFYIPKTSYSLEFIKGTTFNDIVRFEPTDNNLIFSDCYFNKEVKAKNIQFENKVRFRNCEFLEVLDFNNATFNDLADFWSSTFHQPVNFYKTNFNGITVFSAVTFKKNVLFTYSLFRDVIIFRGTRFKKGLDLSLSIIKGKLSVFDIPVRWWWWQFRSKKGILTEIEYDACVKGETIPVKNKRETYRILKKHYEDVNSISDSVSLAVMEKKTLFTEILYNLFSSNKNKTPWFWFIWGKLLDVFNLVILSLNGLSNWFKSSYITGILFTGLVGVLFFNLSICYTSNSIFAFNFDCDVIKNGFKYFISFLNPTHSFDYLGENIPKDPETENGFYLFDYLGRIFVGYGIYQTIQAFRKFR